MEWFVICRVTIVQFNVINLSADSRLTVCLSVCKFWFDIKFWFCLLVAPCGSVSTLSLAVLSYALLSSPSVPSLLKFFFFSALLPYLYFPLCSYCSFLLCVFFLILFLFLMIGDTFHYCNRLSHLVLEDFSISFFLSFSLLMI